ncbi:unnamed protein product [Meloidogyne enterolobii]
MYLLLLITETWLDTKILDSVVIGNFGYSIIRADRNKGVGGGSCIIISNTLPFIIIKSCLGLSYEISGVDLILPNNNIRILNVYRSVNKENTKTFHQLFENLHDLSLDSPSLIITGDFNFPNLSWSTNSPHSKNSKDAQFIEFIDSLELTQHVNFHTRLDKILDLILSSPKNLVKNPQKSTPFGTSDHNPISFEINYYREIKALKSPQKRFYKANYTDINNFLNNIDWLSCFSKASNLNELYSQFLEITHYTIEKYIPITQGKIDPKAIPIHIRKLYSHQKNLFKKIPTKETAKQITLLSKNIDKQLKKFYRNRERKHLKNSLFRFKYTSQFLKPKNSNIPTIFNKNGLPVFSEKVKSNILGDEFSSYFNNEIPDLEDLSQDNPQILNTLEYTPITVNDVFSLLCQAKNISNTSPDQIPYIFLKKCAQTLALPIFNIFSYCLMSSNIPDIWKTAIIQPIPKNAKPKSAQDYRPIGLTCTLLKVFEQIIAKQINEFLLKNEILPPSQHGFVKNKSVTTQLLEITNDISHALEEKSLIDIVYFDLAKAFDSIPHARLFKKLEIIGIKGNLLILIKNIITNRNFKVRVGDTLSSTYETHSGVYQGSVLAPILFNIYLYDLPKYCYNDNIKCKLYADDIKAYQIYKQTNQNQLQNFINKFHEYCLINGLNISINKCHTLYLGKNNKRNPYKIGDKYIDSSCNIIRDLGVYFSSDFKFSEHTQIITSKARRTMYNLLHSIKSKDHNILIHMFNTYIRTGLEFASPIWNPHLKKDIINIEKIQKYFLRSIYARKHGQSKGFNFSNIPKYSNLLKIFKVETLEIRRYKIDLILFHKII